ncbi:BspA family leucine-rich repeat surface protein [Maribacter algarum]|uniref:BspA family leucine-rich repeat surface protein n=1 Tax=Maribacter algarum (ex Zhang et al. 2020) TaxID=2578118 RepID=A0A5S3PWY8_9FLAO|nr:BspA family leucine-rich repeat surface protein [Maribacter algarum]TMM59438.1 BspA family leucine-rich repeat surface protein [Maribacter algarum]
MTKNLYLLLALFVSSNVFSQSFTSIWNTNNTNYQSSADNEIEIPTNPAFTTYNYTVDWGDTNTDTNVTGNITHTYAAPGTYTITISGDFPAINFNNASDKLKIIEILDWGTIQWQSMENAFYGCANLNFDAIAPPDLSQVTSMKNMFRGGSLFNGIINNWDVSTITDISGMFYGTSVFNRPLDNWSTNAITDMSETFSGAGQFNEPLDNWNTASVTNMAGMFRGAGRFDQNINNWNVSQVTNMSSTFAYTNSFNRPLNNWDVANVTDMSTMFDGSGFNQPIGNWNVSNVTNMSSMFRHARFNHPIESWDVSSVTDMSLMFQRHRTFNQPLNNWDVSNVTNMASMFDGWIWGDIYNQPLDNWNVGNVTDMSYMFRDNSDFNQPIGNWDVSNVTNMQGMFSETQSFNQDISAWNVGNVTNMSSMFFRADVFNQPLDSWNVSNVTNMSAMFYRAVVFNRPLNSWNVAQVTSMTTMFRQNPIFNQPLNNWDTGAVVSMNEMFLTATAFDQNLASWNVGSITNMSNMLSNSGLSQTNYDNALIGWEAQTVQSNVTLGATGLNYCDGRDARQALIDNSNWNVTNDIINCSFVLCTNLVSPVDGDTNVPASANLTWAQTPGATGYYITVRIIRGGVESIPFDDHQVVGGNIVGLNLETPGGDDLLEPGDEVFVTIVPYNNTDGRAVGCTEESFTVVPTWVNSPDAFKLTYDTTLADTGSTSNRQLKVSANTGYPGYFTYDYSIDWGDDQFDNNVSGEITHTYLSPGTYTIAIIGNYPAHYYGSGIQDEIKLISIDQWGTQQWQSMRSSFEDCENMLYNATDIPDLTQVSDMSEMFKEAELFNGNIDAWDVSNVTDMSEMFSEAYEFNQPLNSWDVSNVTDMSSMFERAELFNQPLDNWDVSSVTNMYRMFDGFVRNMDFNQPLNSWDVSNVTNMALMFRRTEDFNQPLNNWDVSNVTNMSSMFSSTSSFNQNINVWDVSSVTDMSSMFSQASVFNRPLASWDVSNVTNMGSMFQSSTAFNQPIGVWDVSAVTNTASMFASAESFNQPIDSWNVAAVTNMASMFQSSVSFNQPIASWNVSRVVTMQSMFNRAQSFNQPIENWNVNSVVNMTSMFQNAEVFNQPLNSWDVSAVANMSSMFQDALLFDQPLNSWDVSSVTLMPSMFEGAEAFNGSIGNWNVASVTTMKEMFKEAIVFDEAIQNWDTGEVLNMEEMFKGASAFNQPIDLWDVSFVQTMEAMFEDATTFNQQLNSWNVASVTTMEKMFKGATAFNGTIDTWNVRGVETMREMFSGAAAFNQIINDWRVAGVSDMDYMFSGASAYNQAMDLWNLGNVSMRSAFYNATSLNQDLGAWDVSGVSDMRDMLDNTALIRENYDNTLIAWSEQTLTIGITLGAEGLPYCDAQEERQSMIDTFGWTFSLDIRDCPIPECTQLASPLNGDTDVPVNTNITWDATLFAQGYRLTVGTSAGGNDVVNNLTITNETSYEFATDFSTGDIVYVTLIPFNDEGDAVGPCAEESFTISSDPATIPDCTSLTYPLNGANDVLVTSDLSWDPISNADGYKLTVGTSTGSSDILNSEDVGNMTTYEFAADLPEDSDIYVAIIPYNDEGDATGCTEESFKTELIPVPPVCTNLTSPLNNATDVPIDTPLSWTAVSNATGYLVVVGTTSGGIEVVNNIDAGNFTTYSIPTDLQEDRLHYVTIIPYNDEGDAMGCIEETFTTGNSTSPPSCTALTMPLNNAAGVAPGTNLSWTALTRATGYKLSVGTTSGGTDIYTDDVGDVTIHDLAADLPESTVIYVTITPYNDNGDALACTEESFTTDGPPLCTTLMTPANGDANIAVDTGIEWNASSNADGYKLTVSGSSVASNTFTDLDVPAGTTYAFANDFNRGETITVTITPYNSIGDATGPCTSESFSIIPPPVPLCTTLMTPANGTTNIARDTGIEWNAVTGAGGYKLNVSGSSSTANNLTDFDVTSGTTHSFANDFEQGETVSVTIVPYNDQGDAIGCTIETFTIRPVPVCNSLIMPADGAVDVAVDTNMSWTVVTNATGYRLTVVASSSAANNVTDLDITSGNTYNFPNDFEQGETVTVTITPYNESGDAIGCATEGWTIKPVPACTNLLTPANGAIDVALDTNIEWNAIAEATGYKLNVSASSSTANNVTDLDITVGNTYAFPGDFEQGETVTVTITPYNEVGDAIGCTSENFTIKPVPSCTNLIAPANGTIDVPVDTDISWTPIADATGYKLTVTASNSTANILTEFDVTAATSYDFSNDFGQGETVTVTITPYNEVGDALGCTSETFTIKSVPVCTNLTTPANGAVVAQARDISWNAIANANGYKLTISGSNTTINNITDFEFVGTTYVFPNDFTQGEVVTVTIIPYNEVGDAVGCTSESFTIRPVPNCTNLVSPSNNVGQVSVMTDISWNPSFDADGYRISVGTSPNGTDIINNEDVASLTSYTFGQDLPSETLIYVTITPYNTSGDADGCTSESFTTEVIAPSCTELSSPFNGEVDIPLESTISWNEVEKTDGYRISIGTTSGGTDIVNNQDMGAETSYSHIGEFPFDTQIYVTIIPYNSAGDAVQCEDQSFTTLVPEDNTKYGFSPDGDGINEYWHIENIEYHPENTVMIYNRWGDAVFRIDNYDNGQNVFRGEANMKTKMGAGTLPAGTYFFDIQIEGENILRKTKGYVVIKR